MFLPLLLRSSWIHSPYSLLRSAKWRQGSATDSQKAWVRKRLGKRDAKLEALQESAEGGDAKPEDRFAKMTKGEAANIITRLKHGAQVGFYSIPVPAFEITSVR